MLLFIPSLNTNRRLRDNLWLFLNITNTSPLHRWTQERPGAAAPVLFSSRLFSVGSVHQQSSHSWMGDPNFLLPALRQSQRGLTWSSLLTGWAECRSKLCGRGEGVKQLESYFQLPANEKPGSDSIQQRCAVIGAELYYGEFWGEKVAAWCNVPPTDCEYKMMYVMDMFFI